MLRTISIFLLLSFSIPALAAYKCESDGKITYSQTPCPSGNSTDLSAKENNSPPAADVAQATQQAAHEKKELARLEKERHARELKEEKAQQTALRAAAGKQKKCTALALQKKWATEDAERASGRSSTNAKLKAKRASEKYELACGN